LARVAGFAFSFDLRSRLFRLLPAHIRPSHALSSGEKAGVIYRRTLRAERLQNRTRRHAPRRI